MFNFSEAVRRLSRAAERMEEEVPGFRVRQPQDEVPGLHFWKPREEPWAFRAEDTYVAPEGSMLSGAALWPGQYGNSARRPRGVVSESAQPPLPYVEPGAAGDLRCEACPSGGTYGTTGAFRVENRILCTQCAVKRLGYGGAPSSELPRLLAPYLLKTK